MVQGPTVVLRRRDDAVPHHHLVHTVEVAGRRVLAFGRGPFGFVVRTDEQATFTIDPEGTEVSCHPDPGTDPALLPSMFVDRVLPHVVELRGGVALHASAVALGDRAVAFVGAPGAGKSTLAAALCPPGLFLVDDSAALDVEEGRTWLHPSYPFARLAPETAGGLGGTNDLSAAPTRSLKWRTPRRGSEERHALAIIFVLAAGETVSVAPLGLRDAMVELARHLYRIDPTDRSRLGRELTQLERLARSTPVRRLGYPRRLDAAESVREAVSAELEAAAAARSTALPRA